MEEDVKTKEERKSLYLNVISWDVILFTSLRKICVCVQSFCWNLLYNLIFNRPLNYSFLLKNENMNKQKINKLKRTKNRKKSMYYFSKLWNCDVKFFFSGNFFFIYIYRSRNIRKESTKGSGFVVLTVIMHFALRTLLYWSLVINLRVDRFSET